MNILAPVRRHIDDLGVQSSREFTLRSLFFFVITASYSTLSTIYMFNGSHTLTEYSDAFYGSVTPLFIFGINVIYAWKREYIFELMDATEEMIEKRVVENPAIEAHYAKIGRRIEMWASIFEFLINQMTIPCVMVPQVTISYWKYFISDLGADAFGLPFPMWFPFDWRSAHGYFFACVFQVAGTYGIVKMAACNYIYDIGTCETLIAIAGDIKNSMADFRGTVNTPADKIKLKKNLGKFIRLHIEAIDLVGQFSNIYDFYILICFLWCLSTICSCLLMIDIRLAHGLDNPFELVRPMTVIFFSFLTIFFFCESAQQITAQFDEINDDIYQSDWHSYPLEVQRIIPTIMIGTQQEISVQGFGNLVFTRESFKRVVNSGFSYFTVFRSFDT